LGKTYQAKDPTRLGAIVQVLLGVQILADLLAIVGELIEIGALAGLDPATAASLGSFSTGDLGRDLLIAGSELLEAAVFVIAGVFTLVWIHRTNRNAHVLSKGLKVSPGWAVGFFFVPIAFFWKPFQGVSETWRASSAPHDWASAPVPALLRWWWGLWLVSSIVGNLSFRTGMNAHSAGALEVSDMLSVAYFLTQAVTAALLILIVRRLSGMQAQALEQHAFA
jgi:hypothetical protein